MNFVLQGTKIKHQKSKTMLRFPNTLVSTFTMQSFTIKCLNPPYGKDEDSATYTLAQDNTKNTHNTHKKL